PSRSCGCSFGCSSPTCSGCRAGSYAQVRTLVTAPERQSSGLLIRGFGVQVPGGAPALTWAYTRFGRPRGGRFGAMFAPRLLVSPDLVPRAVLGGLAPARSARPGVPSRPQRPLQSGPTDGITQ